MINLTLSDFYNNFTINSFIIDESKRNPKVFKFPISFTYMSGAFPFSTWNGEINNNKNPFPLYADYNIFEHSIVPLRFLCNNICLEQFDYLDEHMNIILKLNENGANIIEISNLELMMEIKNKYPLYDFIFSESADLIAPFDADSINTMIDFDQFRLIKIPERFNNDFDFLKTIKNRSKIELILNPLCPINCPSYNQCYIHEHQSQINYNGKGAIELCQKNLDLKSTFNYAISLEQIKELYEPIGITNFYMKPLLCIDKMKTMFLMFNYFFKEEFLMEEIIKYYDLFGGLSNG